jgi:hypothetical protein
VLLRVQPLPCEHDGYIMKKGGKAEGGRGAGRWQRRFFRLCGTELTYHAGPHEVCLCKGGRPRCKVRC